MFRRAPAFLAIPRKLWEKYCNEPFCRASARPSSSSSIWGYFRARGRRTRTSTNRRDMSKDRRLECDWHNGTVPENVVIEEGAYLETTFSFHCYRSEAPQAVVLGRGSSVYLGTMFDMGP